MLDDQFYRHLDIELLLLQRTKLRRRQKLIRDLRIDRPIRLALRLRLLPLRIGEESIPLLLAVGHRLPRQQIGQVVRIGTDERRPANKHSVSATDNATDA